MDLPAIAHQTTRKVASDKTRSARYQRYTLFAYLATFTHPETGLQIHQETGTLGRAQRGSVVSWAKRFLLNPTADPHHVLVSRSY